MKDSQPRRHLATVLTSSVAAAPFGGNEKKEGERFRVWFVSVLSCVVFQAAQVNFPPPDLAGLEGLHVCERPPEETSSSRPAASRTRAASQGQRGSDSLKPGPEGRDPHLQGLRQAGEPTALLAGSTYFSSSHSSLVCSTDIHMAALPRRGGASSTTSRPKSPGSCEENCASKDLLHRFVHILHEWNVNRQPKNQ